MITITEKAAYKAKTFMAAEHKEGFGLRLYVQGGGCSGFKYGMAFEEKEVDEDSVIAMNGMKLFIDPYSAPMLNGVQIDYNDGLEGAGFAIKNPNAKSTCGCGQSFTT
ncbi:MAG: iron-sulfur cluster insertion protein ErpA [Nitrospirae bacterium]|nr:iron-sulfur cluster insertion protein ErpA [Candidatus Troglogloeales bacterium]MBI3597885.1 iron-sulfur cluster insertion protein ErpA [Candidatus Troglogloeales bacterium]